MKQRSFASPTVESRKMPARCWHFWAGQTTWCRGSAVAEDQCAWSRGQQQPWATGDIGGDDTAHRRRYCLEHRPRDATFSIATGAARRQAVA